MSENDTEYRIKCLQHSVCIVFTILGVSHHVSVLNISTVIQKLFDHLHMPLFGCRDQGRPAVLWDKSRAVGHHGNCQLGHCCHGNCGEGRHCMECSKDEYVCVCFYMAAYLLLGDLLKVTYMWCSANVPSRTQREHLLTTSSRLTLAPLLISSCTISKLPCSAASIRGVCPF